MKKYILHNPVYSLLLVLIFITSCNGQNKTQSQIDSVSVPTIPVGHPKFIKSQCSGKVEEQYQTVCCGIQDKAGNLWFGTTAEGVFKYDGELFTQYTMKEGLNSNCIFSLLEDKAGSIWIGTTEGICRFDGSKIISIPIPLFIRPVINNNYYYTQFSTKNTVWSMMQDKTGKIWFGTGDGVYCYDGNYFTRFLNNDNIINEDSLQLKMVDDMLEDSDGNIWFASGMPPGEEGLCRYDGKMIESFKPKNQGWIRNVVKSQNGNLLLATRRAGIINYNGKFFTNYLQPKELINGSLNAIIEDKSGILWFASDYGKDLGDTLGGLWHANLPASNSSEKKFTKITNKDVFFILEDKDNNIWFGTRNTELYKYNGKTITGFSE